jgi:DNA-binding NarL/FixJ family response regulator
MIRISALSTKDSFLEEIKVLSKNWPDIMLCYSGQDEIELNSHYTMITDIVIVDMSIFDPNRVAWLKNIKKYRSDVLIMAIMEIKTDAEIATWISAGADGIIPDYVGEKEIHMYLEQLFIKRKLIHPDLAILVFNYFQNVNRRHLKVTFLKSNRLQVLDLLSKGKSYAEISVLMNVSIDSIRYYIKDIYGVLGVKNKGAAVGIYLRGHLA